MPAGISPQIPWSDLSQLLGGGQDLGFSPNRIAVGKRVPRGSRDIVYWAMIGLGGTRVTDEIGTSSRLPMFEMLSPVRIFLRFKVLQERSKASRKLVGGCQNYGPFLDPYYNTAPNI